MKGNSVIYNNIKDVKINNPYIVDSENVRIEDYIDYKLIKEGYGVSNNHLLMRLNEELTLNELNKEITLEKEKVNSVEIFNLYTGQRYYLDLQYIESKKPSAIKMYYKDLTGKHWAYNDIKDLVIEGVVYSEKETLELNKEITKLEFIEDLIRIIQQNNIRTVGVKNNNKPKIAEKDKWYIKIKYIINRLDRDVFEGDYKGKIRKKRL